jgi:hypothetical protein
MSKPTIRIVENGNSEGERAAPPSLTGIRQLPDGSLEYRTEGRDGNVRWIPLASEIRVLALTRDAEIFEPMPRPNHSRNNGARARRGMALRSVI